MRRLAMVMAAVIAATACTDPGEAAPGSEPTIPTTIATTTTSTLASSTTSTTEAVDPIEIDADEVPALAVFLAAIDEGLTGTKYEGEAFVDPESFIITGRLFCELLDEGLGIESVLGAYVAALGSTGETVEEDDYLLGGVVLGASVRLICPEYGEALDPL